MPRLGLKIGTKEYNQAKETEDRDEERERNIEEKIIIMRKQSINQSINLFYLTLV